MATGAPERPVLLALCLTCAIIPADATAQLSAGSPEMISKNLVDIGGGRRLNLVCIGAGSPTVVFEQGALSHILHWQKVQEPVSAITRACFYDRAGSGFSDPPGREVTADNVADDLHALLHAAGIAGPVVLVGHSLGGIYAAHYTDRYDNEVAGLVLVDPAFIDLLDASLNPSADRFSQADKQERAALSVCASLARAGKLSRDAPHDCFQITPGRTPDEIRYLTWQFTRPYLYESSVSEVDSLSFGAGRPAVDYLEVKPAVRSWGDKPVIVLTAGADPDLPGDKGYAAFWKAGHDRLAARSTRGESIVAPNAAHFIQLDQPDQVAAAIIKLVLEVRRQKAR